MAFRYKKLWHQLIDHDMSLKSVRKALALSLDFIDRMLTFLYSRKAMESILEFEDDVEAFEAMLKAIREQQQKYKEKGVKIKNAISYDMESPTFNGRAFLNVVACGFCGDYKQPFLILRARRWHRRWTGGGMIRCQQAMWRCI